MREILFRGKRVDNGEWVEGFIYRHDPPIKCFDTGPKEEPKWYIAKTAFADWDMPRQVEFREVIAETVGQYTGLVANGKKIFEGDILKMERDIQCSEKTKKREITVGVVWFDTKSAEFGYKSAGHYRCLTLKRWTGDTQEVIGNIHDNPEFLEVQ